MVAERRAWSKFGLEKGKSKGPQPDTTSVGENIVFRPSRDWKNVQAEEAKEGGGKAEEKNVKEQLRDKKVKCRICGAEHFTAKCPYKDTMAPIGDDGAAVTDPMAEEDDFSKKGGATGPGGSYVPPHLRKGGAGSGERMGGKYERDDLATLRVTNVSLLSSHLFVVSNMRCRFRKWQKNKNFAICSRDSVASPGSFWLRTETLEEPKASHSFPSWTELRQRELVRKWTGLDTGT